jgi:hypothetical protein
MMESQGSKHRPGVNDLFWPQKTRGKRVRIVQRGTGDRINVFRCMELLRNSQSPVARFGDTAVIKPHFKRKPGASLLS